MPRRSSTLPDMEPLNALRRLAEIILADEMPPSSLGPEVEELGQLVQRYALVQLTDQIQTEGESKTAQGLALSPTMAARCVQDIARTVVFSRGVHRAIQVLRAQMASRPARILYAGCGPYALLTLCSMAVLKPADLEVTLLDIHEPSIESAWALLESFGLTEFVSSSVVGDACAHAVHPNRLPDIILTETMNAALEKEPQVSIARHLMVQAPDAILLPEAVLIDALLVNPSKEYGFIEYEGDEAGPHEPDRIHLGTVFELSAATISSWPKKERSVLPAASVRIPSQVETKYIPALHTTVRVFGDHVLTVRDSGLTLPKPIATDGALHGGELLRFHYRLGPRPCLVCDVSSPAG